MRRSLTTILQGAILLLLAAGVARFGVAAFQRGWIDGLAAPLGRSGYVLVAGAAGSALCAAVAALFAGPPYGVGRRLFLAHGGGPRLSHAGAGLALVALLHLALNLALAVFMGFRGFTLEPIPLGSAALSLICMGVLTFSEELIFRGWLLERMETIGERPWLVVAANGAIFGLVHLPSQGAGAIFIGALGVAYAASALRLRGWELAWGAHWAHNLILELVYLPSLGATGRGFNPFVIAEIASIPLTWVVLRRFGSTRPVEPH